MTDNPASPLRRTLGLPLLVFYGVGVTVGAGIFALIGEVLRLAGDSAPWAFLLAGIVAGATGLSYALLVRIFPRAGGESVFVNRGLGKIMGTLAGLGVVATGIVSSAVISLSFAGYAGELLPLPASLLVAVLLTVLGIISWWGVRESIYAASVITLVEVGVLLIVIYHGSPLLAQLPAKLSGATFSVEGFFGVAVLNAALLAFFAFIGFEDIENMAEETLDPAKTAPRAIILTLVVTIAIYMAIATIAILVADREQITGSPAPLAALYSAASGRDGGWIVVIAAIAMINGVLVQIIMASRVLYGMANEGLLPRFFAYVDPARQTPVVSTFLVTVIIMLLALLFPLTGLARTTSLITLSVFVLVNLSLYALGRTHEQLHRFRYWGLFAALLCIVIALGELAGAVIPSH